MATWQEMSRDCLHVAKPLALQQQWRSSVNRSYYAAYCAVTGELVARGLSFAHGWNNPAHEQLPEFVANNLTLPQNSRRRLIRLLRPLRRAREDADYRPGVTVDRILALDCIRDAAVIMRSLGEQDA